MRTRWLNQGADAPVTQCCMTTSAVSHRQPLVPRLPADLSVKLVGLGGIGGIVARYLAMFLAAAGTSSRLVLIDGDSFEPSNATRMFFGRCGNKAVVTRDELLPRFREAPVSLVAVPEYLTAENLPRLIRRADLVILTVDNHATRKLVNDHCATALDDVCLVSGGNDGVETTPALRRGTYGNVQVYLRRDGTDQSPSLTRYHPEIAQPADHHPADKSCTELVASVPQLLFTNLAVASAILNATFLHLCGAIHYSEVALDIAEGLMRPTAIPGPKLASHFPSTGSLPT